MDKNIEFHDNFFEFSKIQYELRYTAERMLCHLHDVQDFQRNAQIMRQRLDDWCNRADEISRKLSRQ